MKIIKAYIQYDQQAAKSCLNSREKVFYFIRKFLLCIVLFHISFWT
jgi:hypothetical protein